MISSYSGDGETFEDWKKKTSTVKTMTLDELMKKNGIHEKTMTLDELMKKNGIQEVVHRLDK